MEATIRKFERSGDGQAVVTLELRAPRPAEPAWSEDNGERKQQLADYEQEARDLVASFESAVAARYGEFKAGDVETSLDMREPPATPDELEHDQENGQSAEQ